MLEGKVSVCNSQLLYIPKFYILYCFFYIYYYMYYEEKKRWG